MRLVMVLLLIVICTPALAAESAAEFPGFRKIAEWNLGSGENELGCRPADPNDPPNGEYLYGCGPMLLSDDMVLDPVNGRIHVLPDGPLIPVQFDPDWLVMDACASQGKGLSEKTPDGMTPWILEVLTRETEACFLRKHQVYIDKIAKKWMIKGISIERCSREDYSSILRNRQGRCIGILTADGLRKHIVSRDSTVMLGTIPTWKPFRSIPDGSMLSNELHGSAYAGETLEAQLLGSFGKCFVIGINRIIGSEARTLLLQVSPFGAVQDLFEIPVTPWPRQSSFLNNRAGFLVFQDRDGKRRSMTPYESIGWLELHSVNTTGILIPESSGDNQMVSGQGPVSVARFDSIYDLNAIYDPIDDSFISTDLFMRFQRHGQAIKSKELTEAIQYQGGIKTSCYGDDGRYHLFGGNGTSAVSFGVTPEGAVSPLRAWTLIRPHGETDTFLINARVTRTGEVFLDDPTGCRTFRFLPDGSCAGIHEGMIEACITERGAYVMAAGDDPSIRPLLEFDLALNFQRKLTEITEPGGRVGTVRILGLDDRHRLHLIRFRGGYPLQCVYDQETGKLLTEQLLDFDTMEKEPCGNGFYLRHDGAVRILCENGRSIDRYDFPPVK